MKDIVNSIGHLYQSAKAVTKMNVIELHNKLLEFHFDHGKQDLRADFNFESLFEPPECSFCGNGTISVLAIIHPEVPAKYCPMCGRKLGEKE